MVTLESTTVRRVRRNRLWLALGASPWLIALGLAIAAAVTQNLALLLLLPHLGGFGAFGFFFAYRRNRDPRLTRGTLTIDGREVQFDGERLCGRDELRAGMLVPKDGRVYVKLGRGAVRPARWLLAESEAEGRAVLCALGLDASQTAATFRGLSPYFALPGPVQMLLGLLLGVVAFASNAAVGAFIGVPAFLAAALVFLVGAFYPSALSIGTDGILWRWLWWRRFYPYAEVQRVGAVQRAVLGKRYLGLEIQTKAGRTKYLPMGKARWDEEAFGAAVERVREAMGVYAAIAQGGPVGALERAGREPREWLAALRRLGAGAIDHRTPAVRPDDLVRVATDPTAGPTARVSAAVAIAASPNEADIERVRVAASAAVEPRLRVALTKAITPGTSEQELTSLLRELEADDQARRTAAS